MTRCPLCRAALGDAQTCRRCRADLTAVAALERTAHALAAEASLRLAEGDVVSAQALASRAVMLHATPEHRALAGLVGAFERQ